MTEMLELDSDLDLAAQPGYKGSTNRLLGQVEQFERTRDSYEEDRMLFSHLQSRVNDGFEYSEGTETPHRRSYENFEITSERLQASCAGTATTPVTNIHWQGNPWYHLTGEILGILVSICFLSTLPAIISSSTTNVYSSRSLCSKPQGSATESVLNSHYSGDTDRSVSLAYIFLRRLGKCDPCVGGLARRAWNRPTGTLTPLQGITSFLLIKTGSGTTNGIPYCKCIPIRSYHARVDVVVRSWLAP
jgi:hypothetical protein